MAAMRNPITALIERHRQRRDAADEAAIAAVLAKQPNSSLGYLSVATGKPLGRINDALARMEARSAVTVKTMPTGYWPGRRFWSLADPQMREADHG